MQKTENDRHTKTQAYQDLLDAELFEVEKRSQMQAGWFMSICVVLIYILALFQAVDLAVSYQNFLHTIAIIMLIWFIGNSVVIHQGYYHRSLKYINIIFQVSMVSFFLLVTAKIMGVKFALSSVAPLFYVVVISVSSLTMNPFLCLLAGGFAAGQFLGVYVFWLQDKIHYTLGNEVAVEQSLYGWVSIVLRALIFMIMGTVAMYMARKARSLLETVVVQVRYEEQLNFVQQDIKQAAEIQEKLIPNSKPDFEMLEIESHYQPSKLVGGDYFDFIKRGNGDYFIVIADVSGKGFSAAMVMSNIQAIVQILTNQDISMTKIVEILNQSVCKTSAGGRFVTFACIEFSPTKNQLCYINCGHNAPFLIRSNGDKEMLVALTSVLGVKDDVTYTPRTLAFGKGDLLFAFTDGLSELKNANKEMFGEANIEKLLLREHSQPVQSIKEILLEKTQVHLGNELPGDDLSFICIKSV